MKQTGEDISNQLISRLECFKIQFLYCRGQGRRAFNNLLQHATAYLESYS